MTLCILWLIIVRPLMTFLINYNVLKNFFTFGQCSGNQKPNLQNQPLGSVEGLRPQEQVCYLSEHEFKSLVLDVQA